MICPDCSGSGTITADHVTYANGTGGRNVPLRCFRCHGSGTVDDHTTHWREAGRRLRDRRVNGTPYRTLREEALRRGLSCMELSRMEQGMVEPLE